MKSVAILRFVWCFLLASSLAVTFAWADDAAPKLASCQIYQDPQGVMHARALAPKDDELTALTCFGYLHGLERAWQMDYFRRIAEGRKAEVFGFSALRDDFVMRLVGLSEKASAVYAAASPILRARLEAYTAGANRGIDEAVARGVYEFKKFGYRPRPWQPQDSLSVALLQAFEQTREAFERQIQQTGWTKAHGAAAEKLFSTDALPWDTSILKPGEFKATASATPAATPALSVTATEDAKLLAQALAALPARVFGPQSGSNNWVVDGTRTANGLPLLANDPHLDLRHPPFWHLVHVQGGRLNAIGVSLPGFPVIVSGANEHVAWGLTNSYLNVARVSLVPESELEDNTVTTRPNISFKTGFLRLPFAFKSFRRTKTGWPIIPLPTPKGYAMVMRWTGYDLQAAEFEGMHDLMVTRDAKEIDQALSRIGVPSWNFVFADDQGNIGYRAVGRIPRYLVSPAFGIPRESLAQLGSGMGFPEVLNAEEMPHVFKPARGFVATANNRQWPAGMTTDPGWVQYTGLRAFRIEELLAGTAKHDRDSFRRIQCDIQSVEARFLAPALVKRLREVAVSSPEEREQSAVQAIESWNYVADLDCRACAPYRRWVERVMTARTLDSNSLYRMLIAPGALDPALAAALPRELSAALDDLKIEGKELPRWGAVHLAHFFHMSGEKNFPKTPISTPGDSHSVNPGSVSWLKKQGVYSHENGASQRLVVEMTSPPTVYSVLAGSNQDVASPDLSAAGSNWQKWLGCELDRREFPLDWSRVEAATVRF